MMWALIIDGAVFELTSVNPAGRFAADMQWIAVPSGVNVAVGWAYAGGTFTAPPAPPAPTLAQQAAAAINAGLTITSTGTPALNGTYACDDAHQARINRVQGFIEANGKFPNGLTELPWPDMSGAIHLFPTTAEFTAFASAIADYVMALDAVIMGVSTALPAISVKIA